MKARVVFMGTAEFACASLLALHEEPGCEVAAVVTQPDRPRGRSLKVQPSPVKAAAQEYDLTVLQPLRAREEAFIQSLRALAPDLMVVAAYGQILPRAILDIPTLGCVNVHTSLLPKYRGAAPIQWAMLNGEAETGVTIMKMVEKLDAGDIYSQQATPIGPADTAQTLHDRLAQLGAELLVSTLEKIIDGKASAQPQEESAATYARKITKEDGRLIWTEPARNLWNRVRALTPWPGTYTHFCGGKLLKVSQATLVENLSGSPGTILHAGKDGIQVATGQGGLNLLELQLEGGRRMTAAEFLAGHPLKSGEIFT